MVIVLVATLYVYWSCCATSGSDKIKSCVDFFISDMLFKVILKPEVKWKS